jgi:hypothetical protein
MCGRTKNVLNLTDMMVIMFVISVNAMCKCVRILNDQEYLICSVLGCRPRLKRRNN